MTNDTRPDFVTKHNEMQAEAQRRYRERNPPLTRFDLFMNYAVFFGPFVFGFLIAFLLK